MKPRRDLPPRVYRKHGAFWHVAALGDKRIWTRLCSLADGMAAMYRALAEIETAELQADTMPRMIEDWLRDVGSRHSERTKANDAYQTRAIAKALTDVDERSGIIAAQRMGAHSTQAQTAAYVRHKSAIRSMATR